MLVKRPRTLPSFPLKKQQKLTIKLSDATEQNLQEAASSDTSNNEERKHEAVSANIQNKTYRKEAFNYTNSKERELMPETILLQNSFYRVLNYIGSGVQSDIFRVQNMKNQQFAIKVYKKDQIHIFKSEYQILQQIQDYQHGFSNHFIKVEEQFVYEDMHCLVIELMKGNARPLAGRISLNRLRLYATQLFRAVSLLHDHDLVHCDLKLENLLVSQDLKRMVVSDMGTTVTQSRLAGRHETGPRWYRAPEVILQYKVGKAIDIWALGLALYELYLGEILLPGKTESDQLYKIMQLLGFHNTLYKGERSNQFFQDSVFLHIPSKDASLPPNQIAVSEITKQISLASRISQRKEKSELVSKQLEFQDLIRRCLVYDPQQRITAKEALQHPFLCK